MIAHRGKHGTRVLATAGDAAEADAFTRPACRGPVRYSADGRVLVMVDPDAGVHVVDAATGSAKCLLERPRVIEAEPSPLGSYVLTWERPRSSDEHNLFVWDTTTGEAVLSYRQTNLTRDNWPAFQWSADEVIACKLTPGGVEVFDGRDIAKRVVSRINLSGIARFAVSPGEAPYRIALFAKGKNGGPSSARVYQFPELETAVCTKSFFKGDRADIEWNAGGTAVLVSTQTEVDKTGKSYYGESGLYYIQADGKVDYNVTLDKEGPIHDVKWSPLGGQFAVVYGFMPAKQTLFSAKDGAPVFEFGQTPRNVVSWSPHGRFLVIGGFGNLQGECDFWDRNKLKKMGTVRIPDVVTYQWTPDSRHFVTAAVHPRLRVDNAIRVYTYYGDLVHETRFDELYEVRCRPAPAGVYPDRPQSPRLKDLLRKREEEAQAKAAAAPVKQAYRHPNATGASADIFKRDDRTEGRRVYQPPGARGGPRSIPGAGPPGSGPPGSGPAPAGASTGAPAGKNAAKNAKKKEKKRLEQEKEALKAQTLATLKGKEPASASGQANGGGNGNGGAADAAAAAAETAAAAAAAPVDPAKRAKAINKKLRAIDDLKAKAESGETLLPEQLEKMSAEKDLRKELAKLGI
jgi:translation initiation factor 2A